MKYLVIVLLIGAMIDVAFNHGAVLAAIWVNLIYFLATLRRGVWASS